MVVDFTLGTIFADRHVRAAIPLHRKAVFHQAPAVVFLGARQPTTKVCSDASCTRSETADDLLRSRKVWLVKTVTISPMTKVTVRVYTSVGGLCLLQSHRCTVVRHMTSMAQSVMNLIHHQPSAVHVLKSGTNLFISLHTPLPDSHCHCLRTL